MYLTTSENKFLRLARLCASPNRIMFTKYLIDKTDANNVPYDNIMQSLHEKKCIIYKKRRNKIYILKKTASEFLRESNA